MLCNKIKKRIYFLLKQFDKTNDFQKSVELTKSKFKLDDNQMNFYIDECIKNYYIDGVKSSRPMSNSIYLIYCSHIYLTYNGYEFMKNYYSLLSRIIFEILLIIITAIITTVVNNEWSNSNQRIDCSQNIFAYRT